MPGRVAFEARQLAGYSVTGTEKASRVWCISSTATCEALRSRVRW